MSDEERDQRLEEYSYRVWVAVHTPGRVSKEVIFEAIREQWERAERAEAENEALRENNQTEPLRVEVAALRAEVTTLKAQAMAAPVDPAAWWKLSDEADALRAERDRLMHEVAEIAGRMLRERRRDLDAQAEQLRATVVAPLRAERDRGAGALIALQETLDSHNAENPWLGVCAAVALLKMNLSDARADRDRLRNALGKIATHVELGELLTHEELAAFARAALASGEESR